MSHDPQFLFYNILRPSSSTDVYYLVISAQLGEQLFPILGTIHATCLYTTFKLHT